MIVQMQKLTLLCLAHDRAATLETLRELGVLHVKPVVVPSSSHLEEAREKAAGLRRLLEAIPAVPDAKPTGRGAFEAVSDTSDLLEERRNGRTGFPPWRPRLRGWNRLAPSIPIP